MQELKDQFMAKIKEIGLLKISLLLVAGLLLVITSIPRDTGGKNDTSLAKEKEQVEQAVKEQQTIYKEKMEEQLSSALEQVEGIGRTKVMITLKGSKEVIVNKDTPIQEEQTKESDSAGGQREQSSRNEQETTVLITDSSGQSIPYVIKELEPEIAGIIVVAQGAGRETVIREITEACEVLFSVPVHKIKVMKMKDL